MHVYALLERGKITFRLTLYRRWRICACLCTSFSEGKRCARFMSQWRALEEDDEVLSKLKETASARCASSKVGRCSGRSLFFENSP